MLLSMTGFGSGTIVINTRAGKLSLVVEMKTINSRYFEATCKLPMTLSSLEVKVINLLQGILGRGRVYLIVRFAEDSEIFENVSPSLKVIEQYVVAASLVKKKFNLSGDLSVTDVLALPNVFELGRNEFSEDEEKAILASIEKIAGQLMQMRAQEGSRLQQDLEKRFAVCAQKINDISVYFEQVMQDQKDLVDKQLALSQEGNEQAKLQLEELYVTLNKMDIHEEITRFNSHLTSVRELLKDAKHHEKGKRLDFILQELLREINTLMAKCAHFTISSLSVDVKVELEKAREQIQNIV
jgi:uncharacterized protein (TIGR00255 family)